MTQRPTDRPTKSASVSAVTVSTRDPTKEPTPEPTPEPVTDRPTNQIHEKHPVVKPATKMPTRWPTQTPTIEPTTSKPVSTAGGLVSSILSNKTPPPTAKPNTLSPSKRNVILTPYPTQYPTPSPTKYVPFTVPDADPAFESNRYPTGTVGKETKPKEEAVEEMPFVEEEPGTTAPKRPKLYCFTNFEKIDRECPYAFECSPGNPCSLGQTCFEYDCKNRPPSNGILDLCPPGYVGRHTKDCKSYYDCDDHGYVGPTYSCQDGFKFDRSSERCILGHLVTSECIRPNENSYNPPTKNPTTINSNNVVDASLPSFLQADSSDETDEDGRGTTLSPSKDPTSTSTMADSTPSPTSLDVTSEAPEESSDGSWHDNDFEHDLSQWYTAPANSGRRETYWTMKVSIQLMYLLTHAIG